MVYLSLTHTRNLQHLRTIRLGHCTDISLSLSGRFLLAAGVAGKLHVYDFTDNTTATNSTTNQGGGQSRPTFTLVHERPNVIVKQCVFGCDMR